jgi:hypothetical protein
MENIIYRDIPNLGGKYRVSNTGVVVSLSRGTEKVLRQRTDRQGYKRLELYVTTNKRRTYRVHQLVAAAFLGHVIGGHEVVVDHIDNDPSNNHISNLQLMSNRQNSTRRKRVGKTSEYIGVYWKSNRWVASIQIDGSVVHLGRFRSEEAARDAYVNKRKEIKD